MNNDYSQDSQNMPEALAQQAAQQPADPTSIMEKYNRQQGLEKQANLKKQQEIEREMNNTKLGPTVEVTPVPNPIIAPVVHVAETPEDAVASAPVVEQPTIVVEQPTPEVAPAGSTKSRIESLEKELGIYDGIPSPKSAHARTYVDEFGDETMYVENISNGHVVISDMDMDKIPRGKVLDLLKFADVETLKKSRDLRVALSGHGQERLLQRLTPDEYVQRMEREVQNKKRIDQYRQLASMREASGEETKIESVRPLIDSKIEKLRLSYTNDPTKGISPVEFMEWVRTEKLGLSELDYILGSVQDKDVKLFVLEKKKQVMESDA